MIYVHICKDTKRVLGFYDTLYNVNIPQDVIEITPEKLQFALSINANYYESGEFKLHDFRTDEEKLNHRINHKRNLRNNILEDLDVIVTNPLRWQDFSKEEQSIIQKYRKELLDVPQHPDFPNNEFPETPDILKDLIKV